MNLVLIGKSILDWFNDNMNVSKIKYNKKYCICFVVGNNFLRFFV